MAKTGHYASTFSAAEILASLYYGVMRLQKGNTGWAERDRFLLGKGHAAVGLYPVLADWEFFDAGILDSYARLGNQLGDHPDMTRVPGIDFSSGSLGHALSAGLGMALGGRLSGSYFSVFVLLGDGEMHEGQVWEAAMSAAHHRTSKLTAIVDRNQYSLDGLVDDVIRIEPLADKWRAFGWQVVEVDGHDVAQLLSVLRAAAARPDGSEPTVVIARTVKERVSPSWRPKLAGILATLMPLTNAGRSTSCKPRDETGAISGRSRAGRRILASATHAGPGTRIRRLIGHLVGTRRTWPAHRRLYR